MDDVIVLLANLVLIGRFWVSYDVQVVSMYPYVLRQLSELADILTMSELRAYAQSMRSACPALAHILVVNSKYTFLSFLNF